MDWFWTSCPIGCMVAQEHVGTEFSRYMQTCCRVILSTATVLDYEVRRVIGWGSSGNQNIGIVCVKSMKQQGIYTWLRMLGYTAMDHRQPWYQGVTNADLQQLGHEPCAHFCGTHKNGRRRPLCAFFCSAASVMLVLLSSMVNNRLRRVMVSYICMHYMYLRRVCRVQGSGCMEMESSDGILACHAVASSTIKGRGMEISGLHDLKFMDDSTTNCLQHLTDGMDQFGVRFKLCDGAGDCIDGCRHGL